MRPTDVRIRDVRLYFLSAAMRMPLKFGRETVTSVTCARACVRIRDRSGRTAAGWGETPLSATWAWPGTLPAADRLRSMQGFCLSLAAAWSGFPGEGHPMEMGHDFLEGCLPSLLASHNGLRSTPQDMPLLAALVCCSPFDIALHDAYGILHGVPTYSTYGPDHMSRDLSSFYGPADGAAFAGKWPRDFLRIPGRADLPAWHLVGGLDPLEEGDPAPDAPHDGHPVLLRDWIRRDGLRCLKVKLRGNDAAWDRGRIFRTGGIGLEEGVEHLSADFNCTVTDPEYVNGILDAVARDAPEVHRRILYVEQPFPYDLEAGRLDVRSVAARKPLYLDESAHDWRLVRLGLALGWSGVALKTCKTQTGALLSLCWARAHGMGLMVQDLTNPMLAMIAHCQLAAHADTIMGVEVNAPQFYPEASDAEARVHPGLYRRRDGKVDLSTLGGPGFGCRVEEIGRVLPAPAFDGS